jgi:RNA polymerase sigma-70 factor (ECF subfamily)
VDAEDAVQEVFLAAHRALLAGVVPRRPAAWLATIARHECWARSRARMSSPVAAGADATERATAYSSPDPSRDAELAELWNAIAELPQAQREALLLREIRGLSYDQLARHLALSRPSIRSLLERARRRIRLRLRDVHTGVSGIPWVEAAARLFAGGSNPAAPVARVAALGLGAAAITGGAIVTPAMLEHHVRPPLVRTAPAGPHRVLVRAHAARRSDARVAAAATLPARIALVDRRERRNRREHHAIREAERTEHHGTADVRDNRGGTGSDGARGSPSPTPAPVGDSHGGETTAGSSGPGSTGAVSPAATVLTVSSDGGGGHRGGTTSSHGGNDLSGSDSSDGH